MSRGLTTRLRKLEAKTGFGGDFADLTRRMTGHELFEHSKTVSEALVAHYGVVDEAIAGLREEDRNDTGADFLLKSLNSANAGEFMSYSPGSGGGRLIHARPRGVR